MSQDGEDPSTGSKSGPDDVGSLADEAAKLLAALSGHAARAARDVDAHLDTGAGECTYCPVCRTVHALRRTSPEVRGAARDRRHLAAAGSIRAARDRRTR